MRARARARRVQRGRIEESNTARIHPQPCALHASHCPVSALQRVALVTARARPWNPFVLSRSGKGSPAEERWAFMCTSLLICRGRGLCTGAAGLLNTQLPTVYTF